MHSNEQHPINKPKKYKGHLSKLLLNVQSYDKLCKEEIDYLYNAITNTDLVDLGIKIEESKKQYLENISDNLNSGQNYDSDSDEFKFIVDLINEILKNINIRQQQQNPDQQGFASIRRSGRRVSAPKISENCTTNSSVLSTAESSQVIGNTPSEKTDKEKWLSLIDEKYPKQDKAYSTKDKDYYLNANLDILKETIRNLNDKVKCAECSVAKFPGVEITKNDKQILEEIKQDFKKEIKENKRMLKKEEKRIEKFTSSAPKSMLRQLLELLHLSNSGHTR